MNTGTYTSSPPTHTQRHGCHAPPPHTHTHYKYMHYWCISVHSCCICLTWLWLSVNGPYLALAVNEWSLPGSGCQWMVLTWLWLSVSGPYLALAVSEWSLPGSGCQWIVMDPYWLWLSVNRYVSLPGSVNYFRSLQNSVNDNGSLPGAGCQWIIMGCYLALAVSESLWDVTWLWLSVNHYGMLPGWNRHGNWFERKTLNSTGVQAGGMPHPPPPPPPPNPPCLPARVNSNDCICN